MHDILSRFREKKILVFGDVMLDRYIYGSIDRISPESPVPVVLYSHETLHPGGAGNAAANICTMSGSAVLCGVVGRDKTGTELNKELKKYGIRTELVTDDTRITTEKSRIVAQMNHQIVRFDHEDSDGLVELAERGIMEKLDVILPQIDGILVADYAKGVVTLSLCSYIITRAREMGIPVVIDPKGTDYSKYIGATVIKPNLKEFAQISGREIITNEDADEVLPDIADQFDVDGMIVTRGNEGMSIINAERETLHIRPQVKHEVFDVSGAGDTVGAALILALASGADLFTAALIANAAAGVGVSHAGTCSVNWYELAAMIDPAAKVMDYATVKKVVLKLRKQQKKIVFTNGCFDLLHPGHISTFQTARQKGDFLIVAVNADKTVKKLKGDDRPIDSETKRAENIASQPSVDAVFVFSEEEPLRYLRELQPDVLVKGGDYSRSEVVGYEIVDDYGGEVFVAPLKNGYSTTGIIARTEKQEE